MIINNKIYNIDITVFNTINNGQKQKKIIIFIFIIIIIKL